MELEEKYNKVVGITVSTISKNYLSDAENERKKVISFNKIDFNNDDHLYILNVLNTFNSTIWGVNILTKCGLFNYIFNLKKYKTYHLTRCEKSKWDVETILNSIREQMRKDVELRALADDEEIFARINYEFYTIHD